MPEDMEELRRMLADEIPVTTHLGVAITRYDGTGLTLSAPLAQNRNHEGTGFAGSVSTLATLAGWGLVWLRLREEGLAGEVVIQDAAIDYRRPVTSDFEAVAAAPEAHRWLALREGVVRHGRGRVAITVDVRAGGASVAAFRGRYVAFRRGARP